MRTLVVDHPLVAHKLTVLRDKETDSPTFRSLADELVTLLAYEATRDVRVERGRHRHAGRPDDRASGSRRRGPLVVPILRAGLGMLDGMMRLLPTAEVGFLGMVRNEETLEARDLRRAAARRPDRAPVLRARPDARDGRHARRGDPLPRRPRSRPHHRGLPAGRPRGRRARLEQELADLDIPVTVVTAAMDERLNEKGYIVPGLGDAGDRLYGIAAG